MLIVCICLFLPGARPNSVSLTTGSTVCFSSFLLLPMPCLQCDSKLTSSCMVICRRVGNDVSFLLV